MLQCVLSSLAFCNKPFLFNVQVLHTLESKSRVLYKLYDQQRPDGYRLIYKKIEDRSLIKNFDIDHDKGDFLYSKLFAVHSKTVEN